MLREGKEPKIFIIRSGLTEECAYGIESDLIKLVGTRATGTGPLCNIYSQRRGPLSGRLTLEHGVRRETAVEVWGKLFPSLSAVADDNRCEVVLHTLRCRIRDGVPIERAIKKQRLAISRKAKGVHQVTCWGEVFPSRATVFKDARCVVPLSTLRARLYEGIPIEQAAETPQNGPTNIHWCKPATCWGEVFPSKRAISEDPRCTVTYKQFLSRLKSRWNLERAASTPINEIASKNGGRRIRDQPTDPQPAGTMGSNGTAPYKPAEGGQAGSGLVRPQALRRGGSKTFVRKTPTPLPSGGVEIFLRIFGLPAGFLRNSLDNCLEYDILVIWT